MIYELKDCRTGERETKYKTTVDISVNEGIITFTFTAENCQYYCPFRNYNDIHSLGDAVEVLIGSDPKRRTYYEIELSPCNGLMTAKMTYQGETVKEGKTKVLLDIDFEKTPFVKTHTLIRDNGYVAVMEFPLEKIMTGEGEVYCNAYRLETDGGKYVGDDPLLFALNPTMRNKFHTPDKYVPLKQLLGKV